MEETKLTHIKIDGGNFEFDVDPQVMDDIEVIELLGNLETDPSVVLKVVRLVVGEDNYKNIKAHYAKKYGRMSVSKHLTEVMNETFKAFPKSQA